MQKTKLLDPSLDYYTQKAAEHFNVPVSAVTKEQRRSAKMLYNHQAYEHKGSFGLKS